SFKRFIPANANESVLAVSKASATNSTSFSELSLENSEKKTLSSKQFGHQVPISCTTTTLSWNCLSVRDTICPCSSGKLKAKGSLSSRILVSVVASGSS